MDLFTLQITSSLATAGTQAWNLEELKVLACCLACSVSFPSAQGDTAESVRGPPTSIINQENALHACSQANPMDQQRPVFLGDYRLRLVGNGHTWPICSLCNTL